MIRPELHTVRRPVFDCTSIRSARVQQSASPSLDSMHLHAHLSKALPCNKVSYNDIKVSLRLAA